MLLLIVIRTKSLILSRYERQLGRNSGVLHKVLRAAIPFILQKKKSEQIYSKLQLPRLENLLVDQKNSEHYQKKFE